jgi:hypothetical protein
MLESDSEMLREHLRGQPPQTFQPAKSTVATDQAATSAYNARDISHSYET